MGDSGLRRLFTTTDYDELLLEDPDERKIQEVIKNFQRATEEDLLKHNPKKRKGKRILRRNEPFDSFRENAWPQIQKDSSKESIESARESHSDNDNDDQEPIDLSDDDDDDDDTVEERLDELEMNIMPDTSEIERANLAEKHDASSIEEAFDKLVEELESSNAHDTSEMSEIKSTDLNEKHDIDSSEEAFDVLMEELEPSAAHG
ncbi:hypothetical protein chiPu_0009407 [Chiloscyllium punctatum]|uniref:Uncharacterized protein n=1 Tax=Chiloscyllium punctatum TaxID=137246 RepID=A0A401SKN8_CHIPU|nr:hypothetical protein [Chiloscyllium punctatum]